MIDASAAFDTEQAKQSRTPIYRVTLSQTRAAQPSASVWSGPAPSAYWKLDETSGPRMDSVGTSHLVDMATVTSNTGKVNTAAEFTAANSEYLTTGASVALKLADTDFTVCAWVYLATKVSSRYIACQWDTTIRSTTWQLLYYVGDDRFGFAIDDNTNTVPRVLANNLGSPTVNTWYFIVAWRDKVGGNINIQVNNGTANTQATAVVPYSSTQAVTIGATGNAAGFWNGRLDEVMFFNGSMLSAGEKTAAYNSGSGLDFGTFSRPVLYEYATSRTLYGEDIGDPLLESVSLHRNTNVEQCRFALSTFTFNLADLQGAITAVIAGFPGLICDFYKGFYDLQWNASPFNYVQLFSGIVTEIQHGGGADSGTYTITARSPMAAAQDKLIFAGAATRLTADINSTDTTVPVVDTTDFDAASALNEADYGTLLIDNEIMNYRGKTGTTFTSVIRSTGAGGSTGHPVPPAVPISATHTAPTFVYELLRLGVLTTATADAATNQSMHPIQYLMDVLTHTGKLGIGESNIPYNATELEAAKLALGAQLQFRFMFTKGVNVKKFLEEEIYLPCAMYPTENERGELGAKLYQARSQATTVGSLTDADIIEFPRWLRNAEKQVNTVIYRFDYMPTTDQYTSSFTYRDETLIAAVGRPITLEIQSKGIRSQWDQTVPVPLSWFETTAAFLTAAAQRHIARLGNQAPVVSAKALFKTNLFQAADDVTATFSQVMDLVNGQRNITGKIMELTSVHHNYQSNIVELELLGYPPEGSPPV